MLQNLKFGVLLGFMMIAVSLVQYKIDPISIFYFKQGAIIFLLVHLLVLYFAIKTFRVTNQGFSTYGETVKVIFPVLCVFAAMWALYNFVFHTQLFPDYFDLHKTSYLEWEKGAWTEMGELLGKSESEIEEKLLSMDEEIEKELTSAKEEYSTVKGISMELFGNLLFLLLYSLLLAVLYKKTPKSEKV